MFYNSHDGIEMALSLLIPIVIIIIIIKLFGGV